MIGIGKRCKTQSPIVGIEKICKPITYDSGKTAEAIGILGKTVNWRKGNEEYLQMFNRERTMLHVFHFLVCLSHLLLLHGCCCWRLCQCFEPEVSRLPSFLWFSKPLWRGAKISDFLKTCFVSLGPIMGCSGYHRLLPLYKPTKPGPHFRKSPCPGPSWTLHQYI